MPIHERSLQIIHSKQLLLTYAPKRAVLVAGAAAGAFIWALPLLVLLANFSYLYVTHWLSDQLHLLIFSTDPLWRKYIESGWPWLFPAVLIGVLHAGAHRHTLRTGRTVHVPIPILGGDMGLETLISRSVLLMAFIAILLSGGGTFLILLTAGLSIRIGQTPDAFSQLITLAYDTLLFLYGERSAKESVRLDILEPLVKDRLIGWVADVHVSDDNQTATVLLHPGYPEGVDSAIRNAMDNLKERLKAEGITPPTIDVTTAPLYGGPHQGRDASHRSDGSSSSEQP